MSGVKQKARSVFSFFKMSVKEFSHDDGQQKAAALAYFTAFSIAPLLVIATAIAGFIFGERAARGELSTQIESAVGPEAAATIERMMASASNLGAGIIATVIGIGALIWGASQLFRSLQLSLNQIWEAEDESGGWKDAVGEKLKSFAMVFGVGLMLVALLLASTLLSGLANLASELLPIPAVVWELLNNALLVVLVTGAFAALFRYLPDIRPAWRDVWVGAAMTAVLVVIGKFLVSLYISRAGATSVLAAAGTFAIFLLWIFYMAQVLLLGAEMTKVYALVWGQTGSRPEDERFIARQTLPGGLRERLGLEEADEERGRADEDRGRGRGPEEPYEGRERREGPGRIRGTRGGQLPSPS